MIRKIFLGGLILMPLLSQGSLKFNLREGKPGCEIFTVRGVKVYKAPELTRLTSRNKSTIIRFVDRLLYDAEQYIPHTLQEFKKRGYKIILFQEYTKSNGLEFIRDGQHKWDSRVEKRGRMDKSIIFLKTIDYVKIGSFRALFYFIHEMAHFRHLVLSERYFQKIREAYSSARAQNKYFGAYASKNHLEYFAEVSASFLLPRSRGHVYPRGARELKQYDIGAFNLCSVIWNNDTLARRNRADDNPIALQEPQLSVELDATIRIAIKKPTGALTSADIENVRVIDLRSKQLTDLGYLSKLTQLKSLMLFNNKITDVNPLKDLRQLTELDISHNLITDVSPLKELKQLKFLNLCDNPNLDKTQIYLLQKELPKCSIYQNAAK